jgi:hypothetical protein
MFNFVIRRPNFSVHRPDFVIHGKNLVIRNRPAVNDEIKRANDETELTNDEIGRVNDETDQCRAVKHAFLLSSLPRRLGSRLKLIHLRILAVVGEQLVMGAELDNLAAVQHDDAVCIFDRR